MAVIIKYDSEGNPVIRSLRGVGIPDEERERAYKLDKLLKEELEELDKRLKRARVSVKRGSKNKAEAYWELGAVLRKIFFESGLVEAAEMPLFWLNARICTPKNLRAEDRGPNRIHVAYCFRLAGYPKEYALKREWSEWVYLFDSPSVNKEPRFDKWDQNKMREDSKYLSRKSMRLFIQCLNLMLKGIETSDLTDEELTRCYESAWLLSKKLLEKFEEEIKNREFKLNVAKKIAEKQIHVGELMDGALTPKEFVEIIIGCL